jgi:hypothetical protein
MSRMQAPSSTFRARRAADSWWTRAGSCSTERTIPPRILK